LGTQVVSGETIRVNTRFLTVNDILQAAALELGKIPVGLSEPAFSPRAEKVITEEIRRQIGQALALGEAERALSDEQKKMIDQEMDATLAAMVSQADGSRRKLEADLISQGTTLEAVLADQRREVTVRWFLRWKFAPMVSVTRAMLWDYYRAHADEFAAPKKVQMQIIFVPFAAFLAAGPSEPTEAELAAARTAARARIDQAFEALGRGEEFGAVARRFSGDPKAESGGLWPLMPAGSFRQEQVEKAAFAQAIGQISDVIETDEGLCLVRTAAVQESSRRSFEDAQEDIEKVLRDQQSSKLYNDYYAKLLSAATIVQSENFVPTAVSRAAERYRAR
jgi:parvulin-like peptidyl-prolyl isomerase